MQGLVAFEYVLEPYCLDRGSQLTGAKSDDAAVSWRHHCSRLRFIREESPEGGEERCTESEREREYRRIEDRRQHTSEGHCFPLPGWNKGYGGVEAQENVVHELAEKDAGENDAENNLVEEIEVCKLNAEWERLSIAELRAILHDLSTAQKSCKAF
jgi:hypothetical protein